MTIHGHFCASDYIKKNGRSFVNWLSFRLKSELTVSVNDDDACFSYAIHAEQNSLHHWMYQHMACVVKKCFIKKMIDNNVFYLNLRIERHIEIIL